MVGIVIAIVVVVVLLGAVVLAVILGVAFAASTGQQDELATRIAGGDASGLAEMPPASLPRLSRDLVGSSYYVRPMGGARTSRLALTVHACDDGAPLVALSGETTPRKGRYQLEVLTRAFRLALRREGDCWGLAIDGQPFGWLDARTGQLHHAQAGAVGSFHRSAQGTVVAIRGRQVATIHPRPELHAARPPSWRPLLQLRSPSLDAEAACWTLAVTAVELAAATMDLGPGGSHHAGW